MPSGEILFDFDGTLARHEKGSMELGEPIWPMVQIMRDYIAQGYVVKIFTARVGCTGEPGDDREFCELQRTLLTNWCIDNVGVAVPITATKNLHTYKIYDDRAVAVERNTGRVFEFTIPEQT